MLVSVEERLEALRMFWFAVIQGMLTMKIHYEDIRLSNNAGMEFPVCYAGAKLLDMDKGRLETSGDFKKVTCAHCWRIAPKKYSWARLER